MSRRKNGAVGSISDARPLRAVATTEPHTGSQRGQLEELLPDGRFTVRIGSATMTAAIATASSEEELVTAIRARREVLVVFMQDEPTLPVIVGILRDRIE